MDFDFMMFHNFFLLLKRFSRSASSLIKELSLRSEMIGNEFAHFLGKSYWFVDISFGDLSVLGAYCLGDRGPLCFGTFGPGLFSSFGRESGYLWCLRCALRAQGSHYFLENNPGTTIHIKYLWYFRFMRFIRANIYVGKKGPHQCIIF